jgi:hypothetical protein
MMMMKNKFDYKKARENAEKMLEVIERDPQANWSNSIKELVPLIYSLAISSAAINIALKSLYGVHLK